MVPLEAEYGNWGKGHVPGVKVGGSLGVVVGGSLRGAQNQQWEERGNRSLKNRVRWTVSKGGGRVRQRGGRKPNSAPAGDWWGGQREILGPGEDQVMPGRGEGCAKMRSCCCGCYLTSSSRKHGC